MKSLVACIQACLLLAAAAAQAQFTWVTNNGTITITGCSLAGAVDIPGVITGLPVTTIGNGSIVFPAGNLTTVTIPHSVISIGSYAFDNSFNLASVTTGNGLTSIGFGAFENCDSLTNVIIGSSLTNIADYAFDECSSLVSIYFRGHAPAVGSFAFFYDSFATVYYLPGTIGWTSQLGGLNTSIWQLPNPLMIAPKAHRTTTNTQVTFTVSWATNATVVVDASTNLSVATWQPLLTNSLTNGFFFFTDSPPINVTSRIYRVRAP